MKFGEDFNKIPAGWVETTFSELFDFKGGSQPPKSEFSNVPKAGYIRLLQIRDFSRDDLAVYIPDLPKWPKCEVDDIMIGRYGASVGKILTGKEGAYNVALVKTIFSKELIYPLWVKYFLLSDHFQKPLTLLSRSAQNGFNKKELAPMAVQLPPSNEQKRIANKIETLQGKSKTAKKALETAKPLLDKLRQSILASAFRGDLTADWRKKNPDVEPASVLLERIRAERREKWEENELAKMRIKGKEPKDDKWKSKYKEPVTVDTKDLPELPDGWCWCNLSELKEFSIYGPRFSSDDYSEEGKLVLRTSDIDDTGKVDVRRAPKLPLDEITFSKYALNIGDLLITRTGSIGTLAVFNDTVDAIPGAYLIHYRLCGPEYIGWFVFFQLKSPRGQLLLTGGSAGIGRPNLNAPTIEAIPIALPPAEEQKAIVEKIKKHIVVIDRKIVALKIVNQKLKSLDQSILSKAFRGDLIPQNSLDEPASSLLKQIKTEIEVMAPKKKKDKPMIVVKAVSR